MYNNINNKSIKYYNFKLYCKVYIKYNNIYTGI